MSKTSIMKSCLLAAMLASFFVSNGITGSEASGCSGSGNSCTGGCGASNDPNWQNCCFDSGSGGCQCWGVASGSSCP
jgi:hypothetical protein